MELRGDFWYTGEEFLCSCQIDLGSDDDHHAFCPVALRHDVTGIGDGCASSLPVNPGSSPSAIHWDSPLSRWERMVKRFLDWALRQHEA